MDVEYLEVLYLHYLPVVLAYYDRFDPRTFAEFMCAMSVGLFLAAVFYVGFRELVKGSKAGQMRRKTVIEDAMVHGIEEQVLQKKMSRKNARALYQMLATTHGWDGLLPAGRRFKKLHPYAVEKLKAKLYHNRAMDQNKPVSIPGPLPAEKVVKEGRNKSPQTAKLNAILAT